MSRSMAPTLTRFDDAYGTRCAEQPVARSRDLRLGRETSPKHDHWVELAGPASRPSTRATPSRAPARGTFASRRP
jgi:hypothetical protein